MSHDHSAIPSSSNAVQLLIEKELSLGSGPALPSFDLLGSLSPLMQQEMSRIDGQESLHAIDTTRYRLPEPTLDSSEDTAADILQTNEIIAWKSAILNARAQLESQTTRLASLDHLQELGEEAYQLHVIQCQSMIKSLQYELFRMTNQIE